MNYYRLYVKADFNNFKKSFSFSDTDKERLFSNCICFAQGFIKGYVINNETEINTAASQEIDGFTWWDAQTKKILLCIESENGQIIKTRSDLQNL